MSTLGEHQGNGIRFDMHLSAPNGGVAQMLCRPEGQWVSWNEYEKLKAEVERLQGIILAQSSDFVRSKTADDGIKPEGHNDLAGRAVERCLKLQIENERLRKAGDAMASCITEFRCGKYGNALDKVGGFYVWQDWLKAKEGKQS